jgi:hypothetical protein
VFGGEGLGSGGRGDHAIAAETDRLTDKRGEGGMKAGVRGGGVKVHKNTPMSSNAAVERFISGPSIFVVDDDGRLSATGSVRKRTEILWR